MTTTELLQKFKSKKTGLTSEQLVNVMTQILKKINPTKQTIKNKMYLSIKTQSNWYFLIFLYYSKIIYSIISILNLNILFILCHI